MGRPDEKTSPNKTVAENVKTSWCWIDLEVEKKKKKWHDFLVTGYTVCTKQNIITISRCVMTMNDSSSVLSLRNLRNKWQTQPFEVAPSSSLRQTTKYQLVAGRLPDHINNLLSWGFPFSTRFAKDSYLCALPGGILQLEDFNLFVWLNWSKRTSEERIRFITFVNFVQETCFGKCKLFHFPPRLSNQYTSGSFPTSSYKTSALVFLLPYIFSPLTKAQILCEGIFCVEHSWPYDFWHCFHPKTF